MDALEKINRGQERRIQNFHLKERIYEDIITTKDSIISNQRKMLVLKDRIINAKKPLEFHSYLGGKINNLHIADPIFYYQVQLEFKKFNLGAQTDFQPLVPTANSNVNEKFNYSFYVEFKLF